MATGSSTATGKATTTARPTRTRTSAAAKPAQVAKAEEAAVAVEETPSNRVVVELVPHADGPTVRYSRWVAPDGYGCTGTFYAPLSVTGVKVALNS